MTSPGSTRSMGFACLSYQREQLLKLVRAARQSNDPRLDIREILLVRDALIEESSTSKRPASTFRSSPFFRPADPALATVSAVYAARTSPAGDALREREVRRRDTPPSTPTS